MADSKIQFQLKYHKLNKAIVVNKKWGGGKIPWPTKMAMQQIYNMGLWGATGTPFYSGEGSHDLAMVTPYIERIKTFLQGFAKPLTICDLGCGDFNVGRQLVPFTQEYTAIDIVPELIEYNKTTFKSDGLHFLCTDIAADSLIKGDCALLRQVLQHLSNSEIKAVVDKLDIYKYVIVTEHIPQESFIPNLDIISGQGTRLKKDSGVALLVPPFNLPCKTAKELIRVSPKNGKGVIVTTLYEMI